MDLDIVLEIIFHPLECLTCDLKTVQDEKTTFDIRLNRTLELSVFVFFLLLGVFREY